MEVTSTTDDTILSEIISAVSLSLSDKGEIQRITDRIVGYFCPAVILIAVITAIIWYVWIDPKNPYLALNNFMSVIVVACPCALGIAAPISISAGIGLAAKRGIIIKGGQHIEKLSQITSVAFDKTGTLTNGKFEITDILVMNDSSPEELILNAAIAEKHSCHPLAEAVIRYFGEDPDKIPEPDSVTTVTGKGIIAKIKSNEIVIGNPNFAREHGADKEDLEKILSHLSNEIKTSLIILKNNIIQGAIFCQDSIRKESYSAIELLESMGIEFYMLTGDNEIVAEAISKELGIKEYYAGVLPQGKAEIVKKKSHDGHLSAMVGDGINDAIPLSEADIGFGIGGHTDIACEAADIIIMDGDVSKVPACISIGKATTKNVYQNLFFSCIYNVVAIGIAACGLLNPAVAAISMSLSSISVVSNAKRMERFKL